MPGEPLCDDGNDCTANVCDPGTGCSFPPLDEDGDKFAPGECTEIPAGLLGGGDCADDNPDVNPTGTFSETAYGPLNNLWDYNCDGRFERRWTLEAAVGLCESAWLYGRVATCGEEGRMKVFQEGACIVLSSEAKRIQQCR